VTPGPGDIDALLFDFGGILVEIDFDRVLARWAELAGVPIDPVKARFSHGDAYRRHERGELDEAAYYQSLRDSIGLALTDAQFADGWARVLGDEIAPTVALVPRLAERIPCHLFSNTNFAHYAIWAARHAAALAPFKRRFISCEMGCRKPDADAFTRVSQAIGVAPGRILFFDDTKANIEGARAAGVQAVWVRSPDDLRRAVAPWLD
jgi:glucose-1-phosphatase